MATITFKGEAEFSVEDLSLSLLEMSLARGIQHMHACGGNAQCSTCRVLVLDHPENVLPRNAAEQELAQQKGLEENVRLACQTRVRGPVTVRRLVLDDQDADLVLSRTASQTTGREERVAILFTDLRDFTPFTEKNLPYDVVHVLNRYFLHVGEAVMRHGGYIDKYIGDAVMALFGLEKGDPAESCLSAVRAALEAIDGLGELNQALRRSFGDELVLRMGIGVHFGPVILGEFGHPRRVQFTALGDAVNVASRLESVTKQAGVALVISDEVHRRISTHLECKGPFQTPLKGKSGSHLVYQVTGLVQRQEDVDTDREVRQALGEIVSRRLAPGFLRLAFHDAGTWSAASGTGGANGSIRFDEELDRPGNGGLRPFVDMVGMIHDDLPQVSWADLIAVAGALAVERLEGPMIHVPLGREDAAEPDPDDALPYRTHDAAQLKEHFLQMGLTVTDLVALSGAHTVGRVDGKPFTKDLFSFSNSYFALLMAPDPETRAHLLPSDLALLDDPECRDLVARYAHDERAFFDDFSSAYRRMMLLGTNLPG